MVVLAPEGLSYKVVAKVPAVQLPIRVLATKSNGWHDIRISREEPFLVFDGRTYGNPSPGQGPNRVAKGKIVIPATARDEPLFQGSP